MKAIRHRVAGGGGRLFVAAVMAIVGMTVFAGLTPKDFAFDNAVSRTSDRPGLKFGKYGVATVSLNHKEGPRSVAASEGLTVKLSVELADSHPEAGGFMFLMQASNGDPSSQFVIGQWRSHLIVMNGDDYNFQRRSPRLSVDVSSVLDGMVDIVLVSDDGGAKIYLNGVLAASREGVHFTMPEVKDTGDVTMAMGNSVHRKNSWPGQLCGFALYSRALLENELERIDSSGEASGLEVLYTFDRSNGETDFINDSSGNDRHLCVSSNPFFVRAGFFDEGALHWSRNDGTLKDVILNLLGFVPLGFILTWGLRKRRGYRWLRTCLVVLFSGFMLSLFFELVQAWIPSRSSSLRDLMFNSLGAGLGVLVAMFWLRMPRFRSDRSN